jgi:glycosyltransferase involved in cell wall biosynthesis
MLSQYRTQSLRLSLILQYHSVVTHSEHMRTEYLRHGLPPNRVSVIPYYITPLSRDSAVADRSSSEKAWRLVFAGRMDPLKGGSLLLKALPIIQSATGRPVSVVFAGDGSQRRIWESEARNLCRSAPGLEAKFAGWLDDAELAGLYRASDLLVVPSLWPEPFGTVGVKAGLEGLPSAAFAVGGISEWLVDGMNGHLAPGDPPTAEGLARAIIECLCDKDHYEDLRRNAAKMAWRFNVDAHVSTLIDIFQSAASARR